MEEVNLKGGSLKLNQLNSIFETIPVEFDFIDEHDIIRWSSANRHRLFKRTADDLGKHVLEVHPGHSQKHVKQVLHDMHSGGRDSINLMIKYHDRPVNIAFYALRDEQNNYLGCVEVTQDVTNHQQSGSLWRNLKQIFHH
ncbi:PAS domain-containing protein [Limosilactobacillus caecicola]|uniref:PAS domain-containing protein n=1 Tax=Limosilactobacillus caecicola TaxID=2941332 RepID=UPI00203EC124|nr:PAS domain-containing protein [Limosilactobacillus caecicola]